MVRIYAYHQGKKKYFHTGVSIAPSDWNEKNSEVKKSHPLATRYNAKINGRKLEIEAHLLDGGTLDDMDQGQGSFLTYISAFIDQDKELSPGTIKNYRATANRLSQYKELNRLDDIRFKDIDMGFYKSFMAFLEAKAGCGLIGASKHIKIIKKLLRRAQNEGLHNNEDYKESSFRIHKSKGSNKIYLSEKEISALEALDLSGQPVLEKERDRFLLSYYFLLRFSDVCRIRESMFFERGDRRFLSIRHKKTGVDVIVPANSKAERLLSKHEYQFDFSSNQQANRRLKTICALAGINDQAEEGARSGPKSQLVGTHTARRSAATNLCLQGVSIKFIADLGGWKETRTLRLYLRQSGIDTALMAASDIEFFQ